MPTERAAWMGRIIHAFIRRGEALWVAECQEVAVVTQGATLDETVANVREAVVLHLEDEDPAAFGLEPRQALSVVLQPGENRGRAPGGLT